MIELPWQLRVGPVVYRVARMAYQEAVEQGVDGRCDPQSRVIRIREDMNRDDQARILLHEVFHAAFNMGDLSDGCTEEKVVTVLANQMAQIWRDNPDFVAFMNDALSGSVSV